jgi:tetratricopeptide (TPR) repeat protein
MPNALRRTLGLALTLSMTLGAACAPSQTQKLSEAVADYRAGRFAQAHDSAVKLTGSPGQRTGDEAAYLAGMSAYRLGRDSDALKHLVRLADHSDDAIAGPAGATVGLIFAKRGNHDRALTYYARAVKRLKGNDLAQAYYHMAVTEQKLGRYAQARPRLILAASNATDPNLKAAAEHRIQTAGFTLQFGAFSLQRNAEQRAREIGPIARQMNLGDPRIIPLESDNRRLFHVQAGRFGTYEAALAARQRLNRPDVSVEKLPPEK